MSENEDRRRIVAPNMTRYLNARLDALIAVSERPMVRGAPSIELRPVEKSSLGAECELVGDTAALITVHEGSYALLYDFFVRAFSHRDCFTDIGDPSLEVICEPTVNDTYANLEQLLFEGPRDGNDLTLTWPRCPIRTMAVHHLAWAALDSIMCHELVHVHHGHAGLHRAIREGHAPPLSADQRRALEHSADAIGGQWAMQLMGRDMLGRRNVDKLLPFCATSWDVARLSTMAVYVPLMLDAEGIRARAFTGTHPASRDRQAFIAFAFSTYFLGQPEVANSPSEAKKFAGAIVKATVDCELAYRHITGNEQDLEYPREALADAEAAERFQNTWTIVRPLLEPFSFAKLPPIVVS